MLSIFPALTGDALPSTDFEVLHSMFFTTPQLPCVRLPVSNTSLFLGRQDVLDMIAQTLLPLNGRQSSSTGGLPKYFSLCGLGGVGKTEVALEFAYRYKHNYDAIFWIQADSQEKLNQGYRDALVDLKLQKPSDTASHAACRALMKMWLASPWKPATSSRGVLQTAAQWSPYATWLLIFDKADQPASLQDFLPHGNGSILITSRDPLAKMVDLREPSGLTLPPLEEEEGVTLLKELTFDRSRKADSSARQLFRSFSGLPFALTQIACIARHWQLRLDEVWAWYCNPSKHTNLFRLKHSSAVSGYPYTIATAWSLESLGPAAKALITVLAFFDSDQVQEYILIPSIPPESTFLSYPTKLESYCEARAELIQSSLVHRTQTVSELTMHRLVGDVARAALEIEESIAAFSTVVYLIWFGWPFALPVGSHVHESLRPKINNVRFHTARWPICVALYPHIRQLKHLWQSMSSMAVMLPDLPRMRFAMLLSDAAWYQHERGRTRDFDDYFQIAIEICQTSCHPDNESLLSDIHCFLGAIAADTNHHALSRKHKDLSHVLQTKVTKGEDERLALSFSERAVSRIQDGRYQEGIADLQAERNMRWRLGVYIPLSRDANLGQAYLLNGQQTESEIVLHLALEERQQDLRKKDKESFRHVTGRILYALGNVYIMQGRLDEAFDFHQQAFDHYRSATDEWDHRMADVNHKLAEHLLCRKRHGEAYIHIHAAINAYNLDPEAYKPELARSMYLQARIEISFADEQQARQEEEPTEGSAASAPDSQTASVPYHIDFKATALDSAREACRLRREWLCKKARRDGGVQGDASVEKGDWELGPEDFDVLVTFWSR
ncbi:MAG: hypothetical protein Q9218_002566 [Villophora microphyllina]